MDKVEEHPQRRGQPGPSRFNLSPVGCNNAATTRPGPWTGDGGGGRLQQQQQPSRAQPQRRAVPERDRPLGERERAAELTYPIGPWTFSCSTGSQGPGHRVVTGSQRWVSVSKRGSASMTGWPGARWGALGPGRAWRSVSDGETPLSGGSAHVEEGKTKRVRWGAQVLASCPNHHHTGPSTAPNSPEHILSHSCFNQAPLIRTDQKATSANSPAIRGLHNSN